MPTKVDYEERVILQLFELTGVNKKMLYLTVKRLEEVYDIEPKEISILITKRPKFRKRIETETLHPREESRCILIVDLVLAELNIKDKWN